MPHGSFPARLRPWWILGRVSNLPTVWSNCLAAWLLGGGGAWGRLALVLVGGSLIYTAGMFLNDACDAAFDARYRRDRPIPLGLVTRRRVWGVGLAMLTVGWGLFALLGGASASMAFLLVLAVLVYDIVHKAVPGAPLIMALCRYLLFLAAGAASSGGIVGGTVWSGWVLGVYVVGLSYVARYEAGLGLVGRWPILLMAAPVILAGFVNPPHTWGRAGVLMPVLLYVLWTGRSLAQLVRGQGAAEIRATVSGLLAGLVWVDVVAVLPDAWPWGGVFLALFGLCLILQRRIPAT